MPPRIKCFGQIHCCKIGLTSTQQIFDVLLVFSNQYYLVTGQSLKLRLLLISDQVIFNTL